MAKKKRRTVIGDVHTGCDHSPEAHAVIERCHNVAMGIFMTGMNEKVPPTVMMVTALTVGLQAGSLFPDLAKAMFEQLGMDPKAIAELNRAAVDLIGMPAPDSTPTH